MLLSTGPQGDKLVPAWQAAHASLRLRLSRKGADTQGDITLQCGFATRRWCQPLQVVHKPCLHDAGGSSGLRLLPAASL